MDAQAVSFFLILALMIAGGWLYGIPRYRLLKAEWQEFQAWRDRQVDGQAHVHQPREHELVVAPSVEPPITYDGTPLLGAATALVRPPANMRAIHEHIVKNNTEKPYSFPVGWRSANGQPILLDAAFVGDVNHIALTGFTDSGKDSWAQQVLLYLALTHSPEQLQIAIIDGKGGMSWIDWEKKRHVALLAEEDVDVRPAMDWLREERQRRRIVLKNARCEKWEEYVENDLPLLIVFISELMLLQNATSKTELADWMNSELTSARSMGIRYIVSGQTFTRLDTRWRSQIGLYVAGYQPRSDANEPNTTLTDAEIIKFGTMVDGSRLAVAPSDLPIPPEGAGVFTCVQGRMARTVRASYLSKEYRFALLDQLPNKQMPLGENVLHLHQKNGHRGSDGQDHASFLNGLLQTAMETDYKLEPAIPAIAHSNGIKADTAINSVDQRLSVKPIQIGSIAVPVIAPETVPIEEQKRIVEAALNARSRRQVCQQLYAQTGGPKYDWVRFVCDAAGLLKPVTKSA